MSRMPSVAVPALLLMACGPQEAPPAPTLDVAAVFTGQAGTWVDLSHDYSAESLYWPTADGFQLEVVVAEVLDAGYYYASNNLATSEHGGTHLDAPRHFAEGRWTTEEIPLDRLIGPAMVVDVSASATPQTQVSVDDLLAWEQRNGALPAGSIVLIRTDWSTRWPDAEAYLGTALRGEAGVAELAFPGVDPAAAQWLVDNRDIAALGIDTPSIDYGQSTLFETHRILFERNILGFENLMGLASLPETGAFVVALPMKIRGGSGGPLRIVAFVPE